jgi:DUF1365 family protein
LVVTASCFYEGTIRHRRISPEREFRHPIALAYIDLDELPGLLGGRLVSPRPGVLRFRRRDYHGDPSAPLDAAVRATVCAQAGERPTGPIRVLTQLRSFGHCFNPVTFYYCFRPEDQEVEAVVAEVTNTPWGERHAYVIKPSAGQSGVLTGGFDKALHVSPFMDMDHRYEVRAAAPGPTLSVHIESTRDGRPAFDATLSLARREMSDASARSIGVRYPLATMRVLALIYGHAAGLKLAGARVHPHPRSERV